MVRRVAALVKDGSLCPLEPLPFRDGQHVSVLVADEEPEPRSGARIEEQRWLADHSHQYRGEWLALHEYGLVSHGLNAIEVRDEARRLGVRFPLMVRVPLEHESPSAGWW